MEQQEQPQQLQVQELENGSSSYNTSLQVEVQPQQNLESNLEEIELMSVDQCDDFREVEVTQLVGALEGAVVPDANLAVREEAVMVDVEVKFVGVGKRKRGRPPRAGPVKPTRQLPPSQRKKRDEEDVCFICFDGGSLVLCDRRGCPKAYHPSCIKRDESFFRSRAKWNCGWHICSSCRKASYYMCYTCTYSLCKGCTKDADYFSIRGNKGLCGTCMRTIMLIENSAVGNQETVQVDFDDKSSWEYLFKVYWMYLKGKLFLTLDELTQAKNPWNGPATMSNGPATMSNGPATTSNGPSTTSNGPVMTSNGPAMTSNGPAMTSNGPAMTSNGPAMMSSMGESFVEVPDGNSNEGPNSENFSGNVEANHAKRRKTKKQPFNKMKRSGSDQANPSRQATRWATDDLLEFVAYMKNGDTSVLTQLDVQALVLEYVKRNDLRDGDRQCQIVCDTRLYPLFGCDQVGHFEMLRIIESHFLNRGNSIAHLTTAGVIDAGPTQVEVDARNINQLMMENDKRRKTRKKADKKGSMQVNPDEYAAIDVHNINLIYLKRSLAENLIGESEKFQDKVVGSIVRIKITGSDPKQDLYRLVLVTGTSTAAEPYKIGEKTTDFMLEVLNLHKKEVLPIDAISNQEFSEDECRRLRQSIKCGLMKHLTVGEVQEKAMALLSQRVDDCCTLRECVEKLQLLNSPDERKRRLLGIPEVHTDPNMDPNYVSEEDAENFGNYLKPRNPSCVGKGKEPLTPQKIGDALNDIGSTAEKISAATSSTTFYVDQDGTRIHQRVDESPWNQRKESVGLANNRDGPTSSLTGVWNDNSARRSESFSGFASGECLSSNSLPAISAETDKTWNYQDPTGKIQGPFSMMQLRKWSTSGHFPPDLRVWRTNQKQDDSILLTDALNGRYQESLLLHKDCLLPEEVRATSDTRGKTQDGSLDTEDKDIKRVEGSLDSMENDGIAHSKTNDGVVKSNEQGSQSSSLITPADANSSKERIRSLLPGGDLLKADNSWPEQPSVCDSLPSPTPSENPCETSHQVKKSRGVEMWKPEQSSLDEGLPRTGDQINSGHGDDKQFDSEGNSGQSCGQNCRPPPNSSSSNGWDSNSAFIALLKSLEIADQNQEIDFLGMPSPTPKPNHFDLQGRAPEIKQSVSSDAPVRDSGSSRPDQPSVCNSLSSPTPSEKPCETHQVKESQGTKMWKSEQSSLDGDLLKNSGHQIHIGHGDDKQVDSEGKSSQSSGQNWRPSPIDSSTNGWDSNSFGSLATSLEITVENREINFSDLPSPTPKLSHLDLQGQAPETKKSVSPDAPLQDSGPSWSTASSPVAVGPQLPDVAGEWGGYSPTPAKPSLEEWESGLVPPSAPKPTELPSDHAATPTSGSCQFAHSSPSRPASNDATWQAIVVTEPDQFTTLSEESVSDLLAEVEAMESLNGLGSPTSTLRCGVELTQGSDNDCFSPLGGLSPTFDTGRSASLSSSSDLQIHSQSTVTDDPLGVSQADGHDPQKSSGGRSSTSNEVEDDTKPSDDSVNQCEAASDISPPLPPVTPWDMATMETTWRPRSEATNISQGVVQGNGNLGLGGLAQGITNLDWGNGQWTDQDHVSMTFGATVGNLGNWGSQPRYGGDRLSSPRERDFHGRDSNFGRARPVWSRQGLYDDGNGGGSFRPSPRGQRVCKFYESGYCKKGASCSYLHPW